MNSVPDPFSIPCSIISFTNIRKDWQQTRNKEEVTFVKDGCMLYENQRQLWVWRIQRTEITNIAAGMYLWYFLPPKALPSFKGKYFRVPANFESSGPISSKRRKYCRNVFPRYRGKLGTYWKCPTTACQYPDHKGKQEAVKGDRVFNIQMARDIFQVFGVTIPIGSRKQFSVI